MNAAEPVYLGRQSVFNWCQEFQRKLSHAARRERQAVRWGLEFCETWRRQFVDEEPTTQLNFAQAHANFLFRDGQAQAGHDLLLSLVQRWPRSPWSYVAIADHLTHDALPGLPRDPEQAKVWLRKGRSEVRPADQSYYVLNERLAELGEIDAVGIVGTAGLTHNGENAYGIR